MVNNDTSTLNLFQAYAKNPESTEIVEEIVQQGLDSLHMLGALLREDTPIGRTEQLEALYKKVLGAKLAKPVSGPDAREIARLQKELGFILKYKSYAVKAATPFGYSIFLQSQGEGFSYQRHIEHKLEVFHILEVKPGGFVFLCDFEDWKRIYEKNSFERWLAGEANIAYDRYRFVPQPGDVFVIEELGVVHTVVGCILDEFATVSTDMVERLHDQNAGRGIPASFTRANAEKTLRDIKAPSRNRLVKGFGDRSIETIDSVTIQGGERTILCDSFVRAARYTVKPGGETELGFDHRAAILRFFGGHGSVVIADASETKTKPRIEIAQGDLVLIPPGIHYAVRNEGDHNLSYSEHCIAPDVALI